MKICIKCKEKLDLKYFELRSDTNKLRNTCRKCNKGYLINLKDKQEKIKSLLLEGKKECSKCFKIKNLENFSKDKYTVTKYSSNCRECIKNQSNPKKARDRRLLKLYGIDQEIYESLYERQKGNCCICNNYFSKLVVDHNHSSGELRGLLCSNCNYGLGNFKDNIEYLENAVHYLGDNYECLEVENV